MWICLMCNASQVSHEKVPKGETFSAQLSGGINPLSTGGLSKIASFLNSLIGGPMEILQQCRFAC